MVSVGTKLLVIALRTSCAAATRRPRLWADRLPSRSSDSGAGFPRKRPLVPKQCSQNASESRIDVRRAGYGKSSEQYRGPARAESFDQILVHGLLCGVSTSRAQWFKFAESSRESLVAIQLHEADGRVPDSAMEPGALSHDTRLNISWAHLSPRCQFAVHAVLNFANRGSISRVTSRARESSDFS